MNKQLTFLTLILFLYNFSNAQTNLQGKVTAADSGEELISANIVIKKEGVFIAGVGTDFNGNYSFSLDPGTYDLIVSYLGFPDHLIEGVVVKADQANTLDVKLEGFKIESFCICYPDYFIPLIEMDNTTRGAEITTNDLRNSPFREIKDLIIQVPGVSPENY